MNSLETKNLCKSFGALTVADNISFALEPGARHALIGPNGAGKTTFVNMLTGVLAPSSGEILLGGEDITGLAQAKRVRRGIGRTFQINSLFRSLTVLDNVALGIAERNGIGHRMGRPASRYGEIIDESLELLKTLGLQEDAARRVRDLPYGKQRLVEIAIALAGVPSLESRRILEVLAGLPAGIAILVIEHDMDLVFRFARRITVLAAGAVLMEGTPHEVGADARVREVYLGDKHA
jgi:ABC-type branched-subunit amino acid transport system ATPase component